MKFLTCPRVIQYFSSDSKSIYNLPIAQEYIKANIKYCLFLIRKYDWGSYVIGNYYPAQIRMDFYAIQWLNLELMKIPETVKETSLAVNKLQFWTESINDIFNVCFIYV